MIKNPYPLPHATGSAPSFHSRTIPVSSRFKFHEAVAPCLLFALGVLIILALLVPWLPRADKVPFGIEGIGQQTAWQSYTYRMIRSLRWEPFAPEILAGYPILAENEAFPFYPFKAAFLFLPPNQALSVTWVVHFFLLFSGTFLLVYSLTKNGISALVAGLVSVFSGPVLGTAIGGHLSQFAAFAWLPWMAWSWYHAFKRSRFSLCLPPILFMLMSLAAGHPQFSLMSIFAAFLFGILASQESLQAFIHKLPTIVFAGFTILFSFLAAGFWLLPLKELIAFSNRSAGFSSSLIELGSLHVHQLVTALVPDFFGNTARSPYVGLLTYEETTCFLGIFPMLLALATLAHRDARRVAAWALVILGLVLSLPVVSIPLSRVLDTLKISMQLPIRWRLIAWFGFALLAGFGSASYMTGQMKGKKIIIQGSFLLLLLLGIWVCFFRLGGWNSVLSESSREFSGGLRKGVLVGDALLEFDAQESLRNHAIHTVEEAFFFALFCIFLLSVYIRFQNRRGSSILILLPVLITLTLFVRPLVRNVSWTSSGWPGPLVEYLKKQPRPFRAQPEIPEDWSGNPFPNAYKKAFHSFYRYDKTVQDWGALVGIESTTGGFSLLTRSYQRLAPLGGTQWKVPGVIPRRRLNVRYILAPVDSPPEGADPTPLRTSNGIGLFEDSQAFSRVTFFRDWSIEGEPAKRGIPYLSPIQGHEDRSIPSRRHGSGASISEPLPFHRENGPKVSSFSTSDQPGIILFSELYYPGFEAQVDGKPASLFLAWNALMAVPVEAGTHEISIRYRPTIWFSGLKVSLIGVVCLLLSAMVAWGRDRKPAT